jgi:hypothetical protein
VNSRSLPARCFGLVSGGVCPPAPLAAADAGLALEGETPYAQKGGTSAPKVTLTADAEMSAMTRMPALLFISCLILYSNSG